MDQPHELLTLLQLGLQPMPYLILKSRPDEMFLLTALVRVKMRTGNEESATFYFADGEIMVFDKNETEELITILKLGLQTASEQQMRALVGASMPAIIKSKKVH